MTQITEDYCNFEIAKLLKEKGFNVYVRSYYEKYEYKTKEEFSANNALWNWNISKFRYSAPTIQMTMKWLRNIHDIVCSVGLFTDLPEMPPYWSFNILNQSTAKVMYKAFDVKCDTYEEACEAAIKHCLENLI